MPPTLPYAKTETIDIGKFHDNDLPGEAELNGMRDKIDRCSIRFVATRADLPVSPSLSTVPRRVYFILDESKWTREGNGVYDDLPLATDAALALKEASANKGAANGYAGLDATGKIPVEQLPTSLMTYKGMWNANTNTPEVADGFGNAGDVYRVSVAGTQDLGAGSDDYAVGDIIIYSGSVWQHSSVADAVVSINGRSGVVTLTKDDVGLDQVDNTSDVDKPISTATQTALDLKADENAIVHLTGAESVAGVKTFTSTPIGPDADPTVDNELARKKYVDDELTAGLAIKADDSAVMHLTGDETATGSKTLETVGIGAAANAKTVLDVTSTTKGSRPFPSMTTTQRNSLVTPPEGLHIYNTTTHQDEVWNGTAWVVVGAVYSVNGQTGTAVLDQSDVGLGNVDNTSDANKPVSSAQQTALDAKAVKDFSGLTEKTTLHADDVFIINDSEASGVLRKVKKSNVSSGGGAVTRSIQQPIDGQVYVQDTIVWRRIPYAMTLSKVRLGLYPAPTGTGSTKGFIVYHATTPASATTIFTTGPETNAPAVTNGNLTADSGIPDVTSLAAGGWVGFGFKSVCATTPGGGSPGGAIFELLE